MKLPKRDPIYCNICAGITAKSHVTDDKYVVLICNFENGTDTGYRKCIHQNSKFFNHVCDCFSAQDIELEWEDDNPILYKCKHCFRLPFYSSHHTLKDTLSNSITLTKEETGDVVLRPVLDNGMGEWIYSSYWPYDLQQYDNDSSSNFSYGSFKYNVNCIKKALQQMSADFDAELKGFSDLPFLKKASSKISVERDCYGNPTGIYNQEIETVKHVDYDEIEDFKFGVSIVEKDGMYGIIDIENNRLIKCIYEEILPVSAFFNKGIFGPYVEIENFDEFGDVDPEHILINTFVYNGVAWGVCMMTINSTGRNIEAYLDFKYSDLQHINSTNYNLAVYDEEHIEGDLYYRRVCIVHNSGKEKYGSLPGDQILFVSEDGYIATKTGDDYNHKFNLMYFDKENLKLKKIFVYNEEIDDIQYFGDNLFGIWSNTYSIDVDENLEENFLEQEQQDPYSQRNIIKNHNHFFLYHASKGLLDRRFFTEYKFEMIDQYKQVCLFNSSEYKVDYDDIVYLDTCWCYYDECSNMFVDY